MNKQDLMKVQTCVLRVNIHCDGCKQKVKKLLQKIDGVYSTNIDAEQGKVVVSGNIDPARLIKKLKKSGKHAELWGGSRGFNFNPNQNYPINNQFKNLQVDNGKGGGSHQKGSMNTMMKNNPHKGNGHDFPPHQFQTKGGNYNNNINKDMMKGTPKGHKSVKFNLPEEEVDDELEDGDYDFDDEEDDYYDDDDEGMYDGHGHGMMPNKMMPIMGNGSGPYGPNNVMVNGSAINAKGIGGPPGFGGGSVESKKAEVMNFPVQKSKGKNGNFDIKFDDEKKKNKGDGGGGKGGGGKRNHSGGNSKKGLKVKSGGGFLSGLFGFGKKNKEGGAADKAHKSHKKSNEKIKGGGSNKDHHNHREDHRHGGSKMKNDDFDDFDIPVHKSKGGNGKGNKGGGNNMGSMGDYQKGPNTNQMGQTRNMPAAQGMPAMNGVGHVGGAYQGGYEYPPQYNNQQYMGMLMNQQNAAHGNGMFQPMMYARPQPYVNYMPPPPPVPINPAADPYANMFNDENTEGCSVM